MREGLLAEKVGMSRFYDKDKINHSVTVLQVRECQVVSLKSFEKDGYNAVQLASINTNKDINSLNKAQRKIFSKTNIKPKKILVSYLLNLLLIINYLK